MKLNGLLFLLILFALISCTKDKEGRIPEVYVNYQITLQEFNISNHNNVLLVNTEGVAGIIIYRRADNAYVAYDRCSSVNPENRCAVIIDDISLTATDPCSGAKFSLNDGSPEKAPAKRPLKEYQVKISNNFKIAISNN